MNQNNSTNVCTRDGKPNAPITFSPISNSPKPNPSMDSSNLNYVNDSEKMNETELTEQKEENSESQQNKKKIFKVEKKKIKYFNLISRLKAKVNRFLVKKINELAIESETIKIKCDKVDYNKMTFVTKEEENIKWLYASLYDILSIKEKNKEFLWEVEEKSSDIYYYLKNTKYEEIIEEFYESKYFDDFKSNEENQEYNEEFYKKKKFKILEKNGFQKYLKETEKRKKEKSTGTESEN